MALKNLRFFLILLATPLLSTALNLWDQCGGIGYTGPTQCPSGSTCVKTGDYWSACHPNADATTTIVSPITTSSSTSKITTNIAVTTSTIVPASSSTSGVKVNCTMDDPSCPNLSCTSLLASIMCPIKCQNVACKTTTTSALITKTTTSSASPISTTIKATTGTTVSTVSTVSTGSTVSLTTTTIPIPTDPIVPTFAEFTAAVTKNGYKAPTAEQYKNFANGLRTQGGMTSKREVAMFLANIEQESAGLSRIIEDACGAGCAKCPPPSYTDSRDYAGVRYCGRGYMQLSWSYNYKAASQDLYGDLRLWQNPDQVATNDTVAWATAFWFWKTNVHSNAQVQQGQFGASIKIINSGECTGTFNVQFAKKRYADYVNVLKAFNMTETPIESGCYN